MERKKHFAARLMDGMGRLYLPLLWLMLVGLDVAYRYLYWIDGLPTFRDIRALCFTMLWALLLCGVVYILPFVLRRIFVVLLVVLASALCLIHSSMYRIFGTCFSFADLSYAEDGARFFSMDYLSFRKGLLLCIIAAIAAALLAAVGMKKRAYRWPRAVIAVGMFAVSVVGIYVLHASLIESDDQTFAWDTQYNSSTDQSVYTNFSDVNRCFFMTGGYQYLFRSFVVTYGIEDMLTNGETYEQLDAYYEQSEKNTHPDNEMTGALRDKNLILVLLESIDTWLLTEEYMPNLYALQQQSINFENHYAPMFISAATFGSEFSVNTGLVPPTNGINNKAYSTYAYPYSLAHLFRNEGYTANSFHSANPSIYSRGDIHSNWGYEQYFSWEELGMDDYMLDSQLINGYSYMVQDELFFDFVLTYSGHGPYTEEMDNISADHWDAVYQAVDPDAIPATGDDLEEYYRAVAHAMETDKFIGELVDRLTEDGHINDTALVFFADHYAKYMTNTDLVMQLKGVDNTDMLCRTPFFIYSSDLPAQSVTKLTATMDIAPTIANLFDLDVNYAYYTGDDAFGDGGGYVIFRNLNWYDGETYYTADYSGELTDEIKQRNQEVFERIQASWDTLHSNYFAHLQEEQQ